jgi:hypothetical protein
MLNRLFRSRGAGWVANKTGVRKILEVVSNNKGKPFPTRDLFQMYYDHQLDFSEEIKDDWLDLYDRDFLMFLVYDKPRSFRNNDIDHIHPSSLLKANGIEWSEINTVANYQLLDSTTNRGNKSNKELFEWINDNINDQSTYLNFHLIPEDSKLWKTKRFKKFVKSRSELIVKKLLREVQ